MSLLDDVSIVVTPNAYKAGELYAVIPVPTEGAELVDNGTFLTNTSSLWIDWDNLTLPLNSSQQDGYGILDATTGTCDARQDITVEIGKTYLIEATLKEDVGGIGRLYMSDGANYLYAFGSFEATTTETTFKQYVVPTQTKIRLYAYNSGSAKAYYKNLSVKEALTVSADMDVTRATAATRVDENGLVNYAEVVSETELVTCGNFECAVPTDSWIEGTGWLINGGKANASGTSTPMTQTVDGFIAGKTYKVSFEVTSVTQGYVRVYAYVGASGTFTDIFSSTQLEIGIYEGVFEFGGTNKALRFYGSTGGAGSFIGSIDNISVKEVTRDNVPRIDYTGGGCPHILAEPQRTNLLTYSEDFSNVFWTKDNLTVSSNSTTSPDGTLTADKIIGSTVSSRHNIGTVIVNTVTGSFSVYAKAKELRYLQIASANTVNQYANFDLLTGTIGTVGINFSNVEIQLISNEWYRITLVTPNQYNGIYFSLVSSLTATWLESWVMPNNTDGLYIWGSQVEAGSYPTSYIPTSGQSGGVTRNQDIFTRDGIGSLINDSEGVLFLETNFLSASLGTSVITLSDGTSSNRIIIGYFGGNSELYCQSIGGASAPTSMSFLVSDVTLNYKIAIKYKENDFAFWVNGVEVAVRSSGTVPSGLSRLAFDSGFGFSNLYGKVKQLQVYDTSLSR